MDLFIVDEKPFYKAASKLPLSDDNTMWGNEMLAALYKQHPYLGKYEVNLQVDAQEPNLGALSGSFLVMSASARRVDQDSNMEAGYTKGVSQGTQTMRIPVIVSGGKLHSFDVFISDDGKFFPMSEERFLNMTAEAPAYHNTSPRMAAPATGMGGGADSMTPDVPGGGGGGYGRNGSAGANVKTAALLRGTPESVREAYIARVGENQFILKTAETNASLRNALRRIHQSPEFLGTVTVPDAFAIEKTAGGFSILSYNLDYGYSRHGVGNEFGESLPEDILTEVIKTGSAVVAPKGNGLYARDLSSSSVENIETRGIYTVTDKTARDHDALVFTDVRKLDGTKTKLKLAFMMAGVTMQVDIAGQKSNVHDYVDNIGVMVKESADNGYGTFHINNHVTIPLKVTNRIMTPEGTSYLYEDHDGRKGLLKKASVLEVVPTRGNDYLIPENSKFVRIEDGPKLIDNVDSFAKIASIGDLADTAELHNLGSTLCVRGPAVAAVKDEDKENLTKVEAAALLTALGGSAENIKEAIDRSSVFGYVTFTASTPLVRTKTASAPMDVDVSDIRVDLSEQMALILDMPAESGWLKKCANQLASQDSLDSVLSLNFVRPENIMGYVELIPEYEQVLQRLAELLIGARLGLPDVPEGAVESSMRSLDRVIKGLTRLGDRSSTQEDM